MSREADTKKFEGPGNFSKVSWPPEGRRRPTSYTACCGFSFPPGSGRQNFRPLARLRPGPNPVVGDNDITEELPMDYFWFLTGLVSTIAVLAFIKASTCIDE